MTTMLLYTREQAATGRVDYSPGEGGKLPEDQPEDMQQPAPSQNGSSPSATEEQEKRHETSSPVPSVERVLTGQQVTISSMAQHEEQQSRPQEETLARNSPENTRKRLHISNIPFKYKELELRALLTEFGAIQDVEIIVNERGSKGYGFVSFECSEAATRAKESLHGRVIDGRKIEVNFATPKPAVKKGSLMDEDALKKGGSYRRSWSLNSQNLPNPHQHQAHHQMNQHQQIRIGLLPNPAGSLLGNAKGTTRPLPPALHAMHPSIAGFLSRPRPPPQQNAMAAELLMNSLLQRPTSNSLLACKMNFIDQQNQLAMNQALQALVKPPAPASQPSTDLGASFLADPNNFNALFWRQLTSAAGNKHPLTASQTPANQHMLSPATAAAAAAAAAAANLSFSNSYLGGAPSLLDPGSGMSSQTQTTHMLNNNDLAMLLGAQSHGLIPTSVAPPTPTTADLFSAGMLPVPGLPPDQLMTSLLTSTLTNLSSPGPMVNVKQATRRFQPY